MRYVLRAFFGLWLVSNVGSMIFGSKRIDQHDWQFWVLALPLTGIWLGVLVAYYVSRINDGWDEEARERRAVARRNADRQFLAE